MIRDDPNPKTREGAQSSDSEEPLDRLFRRLLDCCLLFDLETDRGGRILQIGAVLGSGRRGETFERRELGQDRAALAALRELEALAERADYLLGHNLLGHDLPTVDSLPSGDLGRLEAQTQEVVGLARLRGLPVIDTLYLSPLAFPRNPYHRLVKDYKLVRRAANDPLADARLAGRLFRDQWKALAAASPGLLSLYRSGLEGLGLDQTPEGCRARGLTDVLGHLGGDSWGPQRITAFLAKSLAEQLCVTALESVVGDAWARPAGRAALAYAGAWLQVAGGDSVLPPWVRHRFPETVLLLEALRDRDCASPECAYCRRTHDPRVHLKAFFGFDDFRPKPTVDDAGGNNDRGGDNGDDAGAGGGSLQELLVRRGLEREPLLTILPTGAGKSLCYQLPALIAHRRRGWLTVVLSPLQALMKDQVDGLTRRTGTRAAAALNGLLTPPERGEVLERIRLGEIALLYVSPEQLRNRSFRRAIALREVAWWVFDEAHCLSKWGHDFRPDYLYAARFIREISGGRGGAPPVACFTATAKQDVLREITEHFRDELGQELKVYAGGVERDNLTFEVQTVAANEKHTRVAEILAERLGPRLQGSAVVYCATRRQTEQTADFLRTQGHPAAAFHAGLPAPEKRQIQDDFLAGQVRVVCATNAFGMGIDKDDVRLVVHAALPGTLENYLQEAGRAGRDRRPAECVLLYDEHDAETQFRLGALSRLSRQDIGKILRGLRRMRRGGRDSVVLTSRELLRHGGVDASFNGSDPYADTKVRTAIAWLERAGLVERNENRTRVFQGRPRVSNLDQADALLREQGVGPARRRRWLAVLRELINAGPDEGLTADSLAELPELRRSATLPGSASPSPEGPSSAGAAPEDTDALRVLRTLQEMSEAGLIDRDMLLTAFVRHKVQDSSKALFDRLGSLEKALFELLRELAPDAGDGDVGEGRPWSALSLRRLNQRLRDDGEASHPETLRTLLLGATRGGLPGRVQGSGPRPGFELRGTSRDRYRVRLHGSWEALLEGLDRRRRVAAVALEAILREIPTAAPASAQLLVKFAAGDLVRALRSDLRLGGELEDPLAALDPTLLLLHDNRVLLLQHGLAVFRQAMTLRLLPEAKGRRYTGKDHRELEKHYGERTFQVHVMNEYARLGARKIGDALALVLAYFHEKNKSAFVRRFFRGREATLERSTSPESYERIVTALGNEQQQEIVTAPAEGNRLVLAGPGSGKTRVVVHRCAYLIRVLRAPAASILVVCFNRNAAVSLRRRLLELLGDDARGVVVHTYHGLAMRLIGASLADRPRGDAGEPDYKRWIADAVALLEGEGESAGQEPDERREALLAGYRHILVDEYQDVDEAQYQLISALAGRTRQDADSKLSLLAVGDDDQNIYGFRGANVEFLRRFEADYEARRHYLTASYRCSAPILAASNHLIAHNRDRMKTDRAIQPAAKGGESAGGRWTELDPLARGRVQILQVTDAAQQASALVEEVERLRKLEPEAPWSSFAVLARSRGELLPVRALCEERGLPVTWSLERRSIPPLHRLREASALLRWLRAEGRGPMTAPEISAALKRPPRPGEARGDNPWRRLLSALAEEWRLEAGDARLPPVQAASFFYDALAEERRDPFLGRGIFLSTVHAAKGMEFRHVLLPGGGWGAGDKAREEERRVFYVAMTRARETLCLLRRQDSPHRFLDDIDPDRNAERSAEGQAANDLATALFHRLPTSVAPAADSVLRRRYEFLGFQDLYLSFAGAASAGAPIHEHLAALVPGSSVSVRRKGEAVELVDAKGVAIAALSKGGRERWKNRLEAIETLRVVGLFERWREDNEPEFRSRCRVERWEVPLVEIVYRD